MPLINMGGGCWKFGEEGKKYCGKGAKEKAARQGRAIEMSKHSSGRVHLSSIEAQEAVSNYIEEKNKKDEGK